MSIRFYEDLYLKFDNKKLYFNSEIGNRQLIKLKILAILALKDETYG